MKIILSVIGALLLSYAMGHSDCVLLDSAVIVEDETRGHVLRLNPVSGHAVLDPSVFSDVHDYSVSCWFKNLDPSRVIGEPDKKIRDSVQFAF